MGESKFLALLMQKSKQLILEMICCIACDGQMFGACRCICLKFYMTYILYLGGLKWYLSTTYIRLKSFESGSLSSQLG
jgi:hypothetical protein